METDRKRLENASRGYAHSEGGMNMPKIKEYLSKLPKADKEQINAAKRPQLNELLKAALKKPEVKTVTPVDVKTNPRLPRFAEIADVLRNNTIIHADLNSLILKYFKPSIKVEYEERKISYFTQSEITAIDPQNEREYMWNYDDASSSFIENIDICGILELNDPKYMFEEITIQNITGNVILSGDASAMFEDAQNFEGDISGWDTSQVTDMRCMFNGAIKFNGNISGWDTSEVTNMECMFLYAKSFNQDLSGWDLSKVENVDNMFYGASKFRGKIKKHRGKYHITYNKN